MGSRQDAAGVFDVSSTSGGGADSSNTTRIFKVEGSNAETYFVVQVKYFAHQLTYNVNPMIL